MINPTQKFQKEVERIFDSLPDEFFDEENIRRIIERQQQEDQRLYYEEVDGRQEVEKR